MKNKQTNVGGQAPNSLRKKIAAENARLSDFDDTELSQTVSGKLEEVKKLFGQNLARIRKAAGYSQLALSMEAELTHNFINELEQGAKGASFETLVRFSVVLRTPIHQFFEPLEKPPSYDDFQYSDPIDDLMIQLHETIDVWNDKRTK